MKMTNLYLNFENNKRIRSDFWEGTNRKRRKRRCVKEGITSSFTNWVNQKFFLDIQYTPSTWGIQKDFGIKLIWGSRLKEKKNANSLFHMIKIFLSLHYTFHKTANLSESNKKYFFFSPYYSLSLSNCKKLQKKGLS